MTYEKKQMKLKELISEIRKPSDIRMVFGDNRDRRNQCGIEYKGSKLKNILS